MTSENLVNLQSRSVNRGPGDFCIKIMKVCRDWLVFVILGCSSYSKISIPIIIDIILQISTTLKNVLYCKLHIIKNLNRRYQFSYIIYSIIFKLYHQS